MGEIQETPSVLFFSPVILLTRALKSHPVTYQRPSGSFCFFRFGFIVVIVVLVLFLQGAQQYIALLCVAVPAPAAHIKKKKRSLPPLLHLRHDSARRHNQNLIVPSP